MRKAVSIFVLGVVVTGCTAGTGGGGDDDTGDDAPECEGPLGAPIDDVSTLTACCTEDPLGEAHCLDASRVPAELQPFVATCAGGGYCIPDSFLETGGAVPPQTCTAFGGQGVCLSRCVPQVAENINLLRQDVCLGADELCVPCISPLDNMPTGACDLLELAACEGENPPPPPAACDDPATCDYDVGCPAVIDPSTLTPCAADAHCVDAAIISGTDPTVVDRLGACPDNPGQLCVPDVFITTGGKFTPATCQSVNNNEGRCLSLALPEVAGQADLLPQSTCTENERCTPCFNPIDGTSTGACNLSCDAGPTQPAMPFAACCDGAARCVPQASVPEDQTSQLEQAECEDIEEDAYYCVPNEILLDGPFPMCEASSFILGDYTGVCLSDCLDFGIQGLALAQGNCADDYTCVPCEQNGEPTGAPGCPP
jgi:hypothetical protein